MLHRLNFRCRSWLLVSAVVLLAACQPQAPADTASTGPDFAAGQLARLGSLSVDQQAFERFVFARLAQDRPVPGTDLDAWYRERIGEYLIEAQLVRAARDAGLERDAKFLAARDSARWQIETELCLRNRTDQLPPIPRADLEAEFQRNLEYLRKPERRLVLHVFLRADDKAARDIASAELDRLRDQVLDGDDFGRLAKVHSDSESRHRGGELGWLGRGELPADFDSVIFALDEGVPSQPLVTSEGVHLLMVQSISPAREATLIEALPILRERLLVQRVEAIMKPIVEGDSRDFGMPDAGGLSALLKAGDADALVLHEGDFRLDVADFRRQLEQAAQRQADSKSVNPWSVLRAIRTREQLREVCETESWLEEGALSAEMERWEHDQLMSMQRRTVLRAIAASDDSRLRLYYSQNPDQFSTPIRWTLRRLRIPLDGNAGATMATLEEAARKNHSNLDALQAELGGELDSLPAQRTLDLRRIAPSLPALIAPLESGELSAPVRTLAHLEIYQLDSREEPVVASFESARERVITNVVRQHAAELYDRHVEQTLAAQPLHINSEAVSQIVDAGMPQSDVSAEALDQLLEAL